MTFDFAVSGAQTGQSSVVNGGSARGIQILGVIVGLGDDDNRAAVQIVALSDGEEASSAGARVEGLIPADTSLLILYPGIAEDTTQTYFARSAALPAKFQIQVSNAMGLNMAAHFYCALLS